jgi:flagellar L-ring protein precursor FlgH
MKTLLSLLAALTLVGCSVVEPAKLTHSPTFEPVYPQEKDTTRVPTGGIYVCRKSDSWFGRGRNFQVGDVITVLLDETTQASRTQTSELSRDTTNNVITPDLQSRTAARLPSPLGGALSALKLDGSKVTSTGKGDAGQNASLKGSVAVSVVSVMANGNLVLRGEKQLALTEGAETIQVAGIIRPEDVSAINTVQSRRMANAQISYRGSGDLASTAKAGWGTSALMKLWPF